MKPSRQAQVLELLDEALQVPPEARPALLAAACEDDAELRREVESLLDLETAADGFLADPVPLAGQGLPPGTRIGPYRIAGLLGRGGMGAVYRAAREDDFTKQVALKLVQWELVSPFTVRRFHLERQILARLEHPNIARLLDGGTTGDGRPYLVMEHVEGVPIDRYCDERNLTAAQRLELCLQAGAAFAYAHQNLVVHRDLKPGNILVTAEGVPKLLDFGIAKLLDPEAEPAGATRTLERAMTPRYASPEQVRGETVTPASDLYSFGVLLYQLLTGRLPCGLDTSGLSEAARRICDEEPLRPSSVAGAVLPRGLGGDVDAILLKALRKEPRHRYASMEHLLEDVRRCLAGHPVLARKGTVLYRSRKLIGRHRWRAAVLVVALGLAGGLLVREQVRWHAEKQRTEGTITVLRGLLNLADPNQRDDATVVQVLDRAHRELAALEADPDLRAELLGTLGDIHHKLGNGTAARAALAESLAIWRRRHPEDRSGVALRLNNLGALALDQGEHGRAEALFREALVLREGLEGVPPEELVVNLNNLATVLLYRGEFAEAEALYRRGLAIRLHQFGPDDPRVSFSLRSLAALLYHRGDAAAAEPLLREALHIRRETYGPEHTELAPILDLLGNVRFAQGDLAEAGELYRQALDLRRRRLGEGHVDLARSERNLAELSLAEGDLPEARRLAESALSRLRRAKIPDDWHIADIESILGAVLAAQGRPAEAGPLLRKGYETLVRTWGERAAVTRDAERRLSGISSPHARPEAPHPARSRSAPGETAKPRSDVGSAPGPHSGPGRGPGER